MPDALSSPAEKSPLIECFVDESNMHASQIYYVGVLAVRKESEALMAAEIEDARQYAAKLTGDPKTELHGQEIFQGGGRFRGLPIHERVYILERVTRAVGRHCLRACIKPYNYAKASPFTRYPPHLYALAWALEHIEISFSSPWTITADNHQELNHRVAEVLDACRRGAMNCRRFTHLLPSAPSFVDSRDSLLVQACDIALFLVARRQTDAIIPGRDPRSVRTVKGLCDNMSSVLMLKSVWPA